MTSAELRLAAPDWPVLRVFGPDAARWLSGIVTSDVTTVGPGRGSFGLLLNKLGKIQAELQIVGKSDELFVAVSGGSGTDTLSLLDGYLIMEDAEIEATNLRVLLALGEGALERLDRGASLPWGTTEVALEVASDQEYKERVSSLGLPLLSEHELAELFVLEGIPRFLIDYDQTDNPHAASLERKAVDWNKGCYLGQEVVCMQDMRGKVKRRLVKLMSPSGAALESGSDLVDPLGGKVGIVTSAFGARGIGKVRAPAFEEGTQLEAKGPKGQAVSVTVASI